MIAMKILQHDKVLFVGDSITDCMRRRPVGTGGGLGLGYVAMFHAWVKLKRPDLALDVINMGVSGNTIRLMADRWQTDVLSFQPDVLFILIGVNDVWIRYGCEGDLASTSLAEEYLKLYDQLLCRTVPAVRQICLMTPYIIPNQTNAAMYQELLPYMQGVKALGQQFHLPVIDLQNVMEKLLSDGIEPELISLDGVHPNILGRMAITEAVLRETELIGR